MGILLDFNLASDGKLMSILFMSAFDEIHWNVLENELTIVGQ